MHVIRFSGNERLSERLSWRLFGRLRRKRIGRLKAVREVRKGGFVTWTVDVATCQSGWTLKASMSWTMVPHLALSEMQKLINVDALYCCTELQRSHRLEL